ncbi:transposase [Actinomadura rugatobispora]|uniref:Transposase n=1 Tax=Actinomadura rugatobispora TaxID=1994 RepID=A0ABW0ZU24_9ACTN|nr:hypothetical protein GCM10010200_051670 [Actinomadura rugatobispora]
MRSDDSKRPPGSSHSSRSFFKFIDAHADWLTVFYLPAYAPELNPAETVWSLLKRSMVNFLATDLDDLAGMIKHRLKMIQHHPGVIDGCLPPTGLSLNTTPAITN